MADLPISGFPALTAGQIDDTDLVLLADTSAGATKQANIAVLRAATLLTLGQPNPSGGTIVAVPGAAFSGSNTLALVASTSYQYPMMTDTAITVDAILCEVTTAGTAASIARLGIYQAGTDWQPGTLVQDAGTVAIDSTGVKTATFTGVSLAAGRYMIVIIAGVAATFRSYRGAIPHGRVNSTLGSGQVARTFQKAGVGTGALAGNGVDFDTIDYNTVAGDYVVFLRITAV